MSPVLQAAAALVPSVGVGVLFWLAIRAIIRADRAERAAVARLDAAEGDQEPPAAREPESSGNEA